MSSARQAAAVKIGIVRKTGKLAREALDKALREQEDQCMKEYAKLICDEDSMVVQSIKWVWEPYVTSGIFSGLGHCHNVAELWCEKYRTTPSLASIMETRGIARYLVEYVYPENVDKERAADAWMASDDESEASEELVDSPRPLTTYECGGCGRVCQKSDMCCAAALSETEE